MVDPPALRDLFGHSADYHYWAKADMWTLDEAVALLLGRDPERVTWSKVERWVARSSFSRDYARLRHLMVTSAHVGAFGSRSSVRPTVILDWATSKDIAIPRELVELVQRRPEPITGESPYLTPHIELMLEAIRHFNIPDQRPKKAELVRYFLDKALPDGSPISGNQAEAMATFSRPPEAMKGGNKRV